MYIGCSVSWIRRCGVRRRDPAYPALDSGSEPPSDLSSTGGRNRRSPGLRRRTTSRNNAAPVIIPEVDALSGNGTAPWIARANGGLAALNEAVSAKINGRILLWTAGFQPL